MFTLSFFIRFHFIDIVMMSLNLIMMLTLGLVKRKGVYKIVDKDNRATIIIEVLENDKEVMSIDKDRASSLAQERIVDSSYNKISFSCLDHICQSVYQNDKKEITIDVEYIDKYIYIYELTNNIDDNEDYIEKFDLIVNSFMRA